MADFRTKIITLAGVATMFAGMAYGQATAGAALGSNAVFVRSEGINELVADSSLTITNGTASAASVNVQIYLSPAVAITSASYKPGGSTLSETAAITSTAALGANGVPTGPVIVNGTVSSNSVTFSSINIPATTTMTIYFTNIKVNASTIASSSGIPTAVTETAFVSGTNITPSTPTAATVAYVASGLGQVKSSVATPTPTICSAQAGTTFTLTVTEGFASAFKAQGGNANTGLYGGTSSASVADTETGYYLGTGGTPAGTNNITTSGTRITVAFANVPANVTVYVPFNATAPDTGVITAQASATAATNGTNNNATLSTASSAPANTVTGFANGAVAVTLSGGAGTVVYEETTAVVGGIEVYSIPVYLVSNAGAVTAPTTAITATVSLAPIGSSSNIPSFISGASTSTVSGNTYAACTTSILFPFATQGGGFDTGLAVANTSVDALGLTSKGAVASSVTAQSGTCALSFYGTNAPAAAVLSPTITAGTTWANSVSSLAPGFTGYVIATCNFQYAHGFGYVTYNLTQTSGAAMGYLGLDIPVSTANGPAGGAGSRPLTNAVEPLNN